MNNYNTLGHNLKRGIINFCGKLSKGFGRSTQKFIADMVYGLIAGKSCFLTEIARTLNEDIALDKTVERLSRNLMNFDGDVSKPHSTKKVISNMECRSSPSF